jgi:hypothetical protein
LLTRREVSAIFGLRVRVQRSRLSCAYQGTRNGVYRSVVVTPQRVSAGSAAAFSTGSGRVLKLAGPGYRGQAQNDSTVGGASGLAQAHAQVRSGGVSVRVYVTYHSGGLRGVRQLREVATLANLVGKRLARVG